MAIPDEELARRCQEIFGTPLGAAERGEIAAALEAMDRTRARILEVLEAAAEPQGLTLVLRGGHVA